MDLENLTLDVNPTGKTPERPFHFPQRLLAGAGPSNCTPRVLHALSYPTLGIIDAEVLKVLDDIKGLLRYLLQTKNEMSFLQQSSGTGGIETIITNLLEPGQKMLLAVSGVWGERAGLIAERHNVIVVRLQVKLGEVYPQEYLEQEIEKHKPDMLFVTHGESSHGTLQPMDGLGEICHRNDCLLAADCIVTVGAVPVFVDRWGIDAAVGGSQKAVGAPPGMALLTFSPRAQSIIMSKKTPPPFYNDVKGLSTYWGFAGEQKRYYYSYNSNMLAAVKEALLQIQEEGLASIWKRHLDCHVRFIEGCRRIGLEPVVKKLENRLCCVTLLFVPDDIEGKVWLDYIMERYSMEISFGIGPTQDFAIRVGIMGYNARPEVADYILEALEGGLRYCRGLKS